jgi:NADH:ubiquinone oxidoreductase subunit 6 (subunit J)
LSCIERQRRLERRRGRTVEVKRMQAIDPILALFEQVEFILIAALILILAYLALEHKDIVYAAFFFGFMATFVAGFYLLLDAPFIAGMQIAVYTGGISALIIFGVLLLPHAQDTTLETLVSPRKRKLGLFIAAVVMFMSGGLALAFPWPTSIPSAIPAFTQSLQGLAEWLWQEHGLYVQIIGLIIFTTLVGTLALLKMDKAEALGEIKGEFGVEAEPEPETRPEQKPEPEPEVAPEEVDE